MDDDEDTREMYAWCMRASGWLAEGVADGDGVLFAAQLFTPDVIVMDLRLPVISGFETIRRLKANVNTKHIPVVVFCSGIDRFEAECRAMQAGCDAFVARPCAPEDLRALLRELVSRGG